jgi:hypothetical protein
VHIYLYRYIYSLSMNASSRNFPLELLLFPLLHRKRFIMLPTLQNIRQVNNFVIQPHTTICMHCANFVKIIAELAEPTTICCVQKLQPQSNSLSVIFLNFVEHILLMQFWEVVSCIVPIPVELDCFIGRPSVEKAAIWEIQHAVFVSNKAVTRDCNVGCYGNVSQRISEPHYVHIL